MSRILLLAALLSALVGCLDFVGTDYVIDLKAGTATVRYLDLRGDADDLAQVRRDYVEGDDLQGAWPRARVGARALVPRDDALDLEVQLGFDAPSDVGVLAWDARRPYRFCPPDGQVIARSNARWRDGDGCAVWPKGTSVLRVTTTTLAQSLSPSLAIPWAAPAPEPPG